MLRKKYVYVSKNETWEISMTYMIDTFEWRTVILS